MKNKFCRKGIVPIVIISLLLVVSVLAFLYLNDWFVLFKSEIETDLYGKDFTRSVEIKKVDENYLMIENDFGKDIKLEKIKFGDEICDIEDIILEAGLNVVDVGLCARDVGEVESVETVLITDQGVKSEFEIVKDIVRSPLVVRFVFGNCDFSKGYVRLLGLSELDVGHAEVGSSSLYTYSVCVRHLNYTLSAGTGAFKQEIVSLLNESNSHIFTSTASVYQAPLQWHNVTLYSSGGTWDVFVGSTAPSSAYSCLFSLDEDNVYGSMIGDCDSSSLPDKFWAKLD
ncbi:MAG: hypothetical protein ACOCXG_02690 [Nanoarchaeota archaeon]